MKTTQLEAAGFFAMSPDGETAFGFGASKGEALRVADFLNPSDKYRRERKHIVYKPCTKKVLDMRPLVVQVRDGIFCTTDEAGEYDYNALLARLAAQREDETCKQSN